MGKLAFDNYPTPQELAQAITNHLATLIPQPMLVVEPSCGEGNFIKATQATWPGVLCTGVDIQDYSAQVTALGATFQQQDWLDCIPQFARMPNMLVLGNPPYSNNQPQRHIEAVMDQTQDGTRVAFLLRLAMLGGVKRAETLWARGNLEFLTPIAGRPKFDPDPETTSDPMEYGVFVFRKGHQGPAIINKPLLWRESKRKRAVAV